MGPIFSAIISVVLGLGVSFLIFWLLNWIVEQHQRQDEGAAAALCLPPARHRPRRRLPALSRLCAPSWRAS